MRRLVLTVALASSLAALTGCRHVAVYERSKLAHPTMTTASSAGVAEEHMYAVHEGAVGGSATAESGCGCN